MKIEIIKESEEVVLKVFGEIDGSNVDLFEAKMIEAVEERMPLVVDLSDLDYLSSAGLRVFLITSKRAKQNGFSMIVKNANEDVMDIFTVTGFVQLLDIQ